MTRQPGPRRSAVPDGWPGDDPTVQDDVVVLGGRRPARHDRPRPASPLPGAPAGPAGAGEPAGAGPGRFPPATATGDDGDDGDDGVDGVGSHLDDPLVAGHQPAGRVLVVMVATLALTVLVNADALVARAEERPAGPGRDRALAVWHPIQDAGHALQLHRVRQVLERLVGGGGGEPVPVPPAAGVPRPGPAGGGAGAPTGGGRAPAPDPGGASPSEALPDVPRLRTPTAGDPLRLWVGGDAVARDTGVALAAQGEATGLVETTVHVEAASGLVRQDYFDWPAALDADVAEDRSEVVVFVVGVNDGQGIVLPDGTPVPDVHDPRWAQEYGRRAGDLMDRLRADDRLVLWVLLPPVADPDMAARQDVIRGAVRAAAAGRPWVVTVDAAASLAPGGGYVRALPDASGRPVDVRRADGIHLTEAGGARLAAQVLATVDRHVDVLR